MSYELVDVTKPAGDNPGAGGGLKTVVYIAALSDILTFPARDVDLASITTPFVFASTKSLHTLYATDKTIEPKETKLAGENKDCGGVEITLSFFHPGLSPEIQSFKAQQMNGDFILIIRDFVNDTSYVIGEEGNPAWLENWEAAWGKTIAEGKGSTFTFKAQQSLPMAVYIPDPEDLLTPAV